MKQLAWHLPCFLQGQTGLENTTRRIGSWQRGWWRAGGSIWVFSNSPQVIGGNFDWPASLFCSEYMVTLMDKVQIPNSWVRFYISASRYREKLVGGVERYWNKSGSPES